MKLGLANMLQVGSTPFSALTRIRGQWTDASQSARSLSVDWQAWGTKGGLCWRATRGGHKKLSGPHPPWRARLMVLLDPADLRHSHRGTMGSADRAL
jgi:hypothetical protein